MRECLATARPGGGGNAAAQGLLASTAANPLKPRVDAWLRRLQRVQLLAAFARSGCVSRPRRVAGFVTVHRDVRLPDQFNTVAAVAWVDGEADARRQRNLDVVDKKGNFKGGADFFRCCSRTSLTSQFRQQDNEFVATVPADGIVMRTQEQRRVPNCCSSLSPAACPSVSLMFLNPSRSRKRRATWLRWRFARATACPIRSDSKRRFGRPVSSSRRTAPGIRRPKKLRG